MQPIEMRPLKDVTIYDIAKAVNVSPATVSRGLKDHPGIRKDTKKKILEAARKMGYQHNNFASNLRRKRTNTLGVIVPRLNSYFTATVISGMEKIANDAGYNLIISQSMESFQKEKANAKIMFNSRVDGLMVSLAYDTEDISHFSDFIDKGIPTLFFDRVFDHKQCVSVVIDNFQAAYELTSHLLEQGSRTIAHITGSLKRNVYSERLKGYHKALSDHGVAFRDDLVIVNELSEEAGVEAGHQLLKMIPRPDGVFVANDMCAAFCMRTVKEAGLSIPEDIAFTGFNNDPISRVIEPNLTTINYPAYQLGVVAAQNMINTLNNAPSQNMNSLLLRHDLIERKSSLRKVKEKSVA